MVDLAEKVRVRGDITRFFQQRLMQLVAHQIATDMPQIVLVDSPIEACSKLTDFNIPRDCIPTSHGGTWTFDRIFEWYGILLRQPHTMDNFQNGGNNLRPQVDETAVSDTSSLATTSRAQQPQYSASRGRNGAVARHTNNAIYCRRAYEKRKQKHTQLEDEAIRLRAEHARLTKEHVRLKLLVQQALDLVLPSSIPQHSDLSFQQGLMMG